MFIEFGKELTEKELDFIKLLNGIPIEVGYSKQTIEMKYYEGDNVFKKEFNGKLECHYNFEYNTTTQDEVEYSNYYCFQWEEELV